MNAELSPPAPALTRATAPDWLLAAALAAVSLALFWPALDYKFLTYDDDLYVAREPMVNQGFRPAAILWTLTQPHSYNWHPLTTFTHMAMCQCFELNPRAHHALNLGLHAVNAALCFLAFRRLTGARWPSAFAAALFALHPLRAESVAWVAEMKDLLCGFFWLLAILAYAHFIQRRSWRRYALLAGATVCALLAKPMAVTLPATLLLLDFWPLRRWPALSWPALLREKGWLFLLVAVHSVITVRVQMETGAGDFSHGVPAAARVGNALVSYLRYLGKFFWPAELPALYPHPIWWPWTDLLASAAVLTALSYVAWRCARSRPWVTVGWCWFLGTLVPAIGFIQVGVQSMANRYMYLPALGLGMAVTWTLAAALARLPRGRWLGAAGAAGVIATLWMVCRAALVPWRDSVALFEYALAANDRPTLVRYWLAEALTAANRPMEAETHLLRLIREDPTYLNTYAQLSGIYARLGRDAESTAMLRQALAVKPDSFEAMNNLGWKLSSERKLPEAFALLEKADRLGPRSHAVKSNLGTYYMLIGQYARAETYFREALQLNPWGTGNHNDLAVNLFHQGAMSEARRVFEKGLWINPRLPALLSHYADFLNRVGDGAGAAKARAALAVELARKP